MWLLFALLSALFAALVAIFSKIGIKNIDRVLATAIRAFFMLVILAGVVAFQRKFSGIGSIDNKALMFIILGGIAGPFPGYSILRL